MTTNGNTIKRDGFTAATTLVVVAIIATVTLVFVGALYFTGQNNAEKQQRFRMTCVDAGGSWVEESCINPTATEDTPVAVPAPVPAPVKP